jgi:GNAT superfamily N-acetyltransferase
VLLGTWLMRFSEGLSRRANSINPLRAEYHDLAAAIAAGPPLYRAQRLPTIFRIPSIVDPAVDHELASHGYTAEGESCVLYGAIDSLAAEADSEVQLHAAPNQEWLAAMAALQGHSAERAVIYRRIIGAIAIPARFALLAVDGAPAALAYGAVHDGLLCYESVITDPARRRQRLAYRIIGALADWAREAGAGGACLQVEAGNVAGRALYDRFGLTAELYRYHYRREPPAR